MLYKIEAKYDNASLKALFSKLTDGTIEGQEPDGKEIIKAMKSAKIVSKNSIVWYETCFCATPLNHERTTVYDDYFYDFRPILVEKSEDDIVGESFWEYMRAL